MKHIFNIITDSPKLINKTKQDLQNIINKNLTKYDQVGARPKFEGIEDRENGHTKISLIVAPFLATYKNGKYNSEKDKWHYRVTIEENGDAKVEKIEWFTS